MKKIICLMLIICMVTIPIYAEPSDWAIEAIESLEASDDFDSNFFDNYQEPITRLEFAYLSARLFEILNEEEIIVDDFVTFRDTNDIYARKAGQVGITSGIGNNMFDPNGYLTREQLAVMIMKTLNLGRLEVGIDMKVSFNDSSYFSEWALDAINMAYANDFVSGTGQGNFSPKGFATKEQALVIINNILKQYRGKPFNYNPANENVLRISVEDQTSTVFGSYVKIYKDDDYLGYTDLEGKLIVRNLPLGLHELTIIFKDGTTVKAGANVKIVDSYALLWIDEEIINRNAFK